MLADIMYKLNYQTRLSIWAILNKNIRLLADALCI